jgi:hypothetical protein
MSCVIAVAPGDAKIPQALVPDRRHLSRGTGEDRLPQKHKGRPPLDGPLIF